MKKTYAILAAVAFSVLLVYWMLPNRYFEESVFPMQEGVVLLGYDDQADGGTSEISMEVDENTLGFTCKLGADTTKSAWCGLLWNMDPDSQMVYRNWTFVDSLILDVEAFGTSEVLLKVWTYDPDVTDIKKPRSFRLLMKELPLKEGAQRLAIPMEDLYTPDFWYEDGKVDRELNRRHQETVARLEIAPGWNQPREKKFSIKFKSITAKGVSNLAFGTVLFIFLFLTIVAIGRGHKYRHDTLKE
ncbi:MAG: hypothetical protein HUK21_07690 [Fibrobacteraceae bacterium]|nr:hypothetical protein [Fibrobacteraceae bacterium]